VELLVGAACAASSRIFVVLGQEMDVLWGFMDTSKPIVFLDTCRQMRCVAGSFAVSHALPGVVTGVSGIRYPS
jgi:hypothetical protein